MRRNRVPPGGAETRSEARFATPPMNNSRAERPAGRRAFRWVALSEHHRREMLGHVEIERLTDRRPACPVRMRRLVRALVEVPAPPPLRRRSQRTDIRLKELIRN